MCTTKFQPADFVLLVKILSCMALFFFFSPVFSVTQLRACAEFEWNKRMTCAGYAVFCVIAAEAACVCLCVLLEYCPRQYNDGDLAHVAVQSWVRV